MPKQTLQQKIRRALGRFTAKRIAMILLGTAILSFGIHNIHRRTAITDLSAATTFFNSLNGRRQAWRSA